MNDKIEKKRKFEAFLEYMKLATEFEALWLEASKHEFVYLKPLEDWRDKNWKEMERLRKIWSKKGEKANE